jgi:hypothetical protein
LSFIGNNLQDLTAVEVPTQLLQTRLLSVAAVFIIIIIIIIIIINCNSVVTRWLFKRQMIVLQLVGLMSRVLQIVGLIPRVLQLVGPMSLALQLV